MRQTLPILLCLIVFSKNHAQVVFCPPGAEWRYSFTEMQGHTIENEKITYVKDSIVGPDILKMLYHSRFFRRCNFPVSPTFIKQKGDTIFFRNSQTQNNWQILYNFAAMVGQGWQTTVFQKNGNSVTYNYVVSSVDYITVNGFSLKQLTVFDEVSGVVKITERFGSSQFFFNYENSGIGNCDGDSFQEFLCYQDNSFGIKQFTSKPCDYSNLAGISESNINNLKIYPNPISEILNIDLQNTGSTSHQIKLLNLLGEEVHAGIRSNESRIELDIQELKKGIYFLQIFNKDKLIVNEKIIKD